MPIAVHFFPSQMPRATFNEILDRLEKQGLGSPKGRHLHVSFGPADNFQVFDIWDSQADLDAFGMRLKPILDDLGVTLNRVEVNEVISISNSTGAIDMVHPTPV